MTGIRTGRDARAGLRSRLRRVVAVGGLVLLGTTTMGCQKVVDQFKAKQLIRKGNQYFKEQLYEDALKQYEEAAKLDPSEVRLRKFVAMANMAIYSPGSQHPKDVAALEAAIKNFKEYLAVRPDVPHRSGDAAVPPNRKSHHRTPAVQCTRPWRHDAWAPADTLRGPATPGPDGAASQRGDLDGMGDLRR